MDLNSFDPSTMTWAAQMAHPDVNEQPDPYHEMLLPVDLPDQHSSYSYGLAGYGRMVLLRIMSSHGD